MGHTTRAQHDSGGIWLEASRENRVQMMSKSLYQEHNVEPIGEEFPPLIDLKPQIGHNIGFKLNTQSASAPSRS